MGILEWDDQMQDMLGKTFAVLEVVDSDIIAIHSPDRSQNGKWYFHTSVFDRSGMETIIQSIAN